MPVLHRLVWDRQFWARRFWTRVLQFVLVNCAVFAAYRVSFIRLFGGPKALAGTPVALVTRRPRLRFTAAGVWGSKGRCQS